jgi:hypothetical protein
MRRRTSRNADYLQRHSVTLAQQCIVAQHKLEEPPTDIA